MRVVLCQTDIAWEDKAANHAKVRELLDGRRAECRGALIVLPEMFSTGFSMDVRCIEEGEPRLSEHFLGELARTHAACLVGGVVNSANGKGLNQSLAVGPDGGLLARYSKMQPFALGGETLHYESGKELVLFNFGGFKIAQFVCYDLRFPELFRAAAVRGAEVFTVIANWPFPRDAHWTALLRARAIENQAYVIGVNRCGRDPKYVYPGRSVVIDPHGETLIDAGAGEGVACCEIERNALLEYRRAFPALADMRAEFREFFRSRDAALRDEPSSLPH